MEKRIFIQLIFLGVFIIPLSPTISSSDIVFAADNNSYSATFYFTSGLDKKFLLKIYYDIEYFKHIYKQFNTIKILQEGEDWCRINFINKTGLYILNTIYKRMLIKDEDKITFALEKYDQNADILPELVSSTGYYAVEKSGTKNRVVYHQDTRLLQSCHPLQKALIRKNLEKFAKTMADYIDEVESQQSK